MTTSSEPDNHPCALSLELDGVGQFVIIDLVGSVLHSVEAEPCGFRILGEAASVGEVVASVVPITTVRADR